MMTLHCSHGLPVSTRCNGCLDDGLAREEARKPKSLKARKCSICKQKYIPRRPLQTTCGYPAPCEALKAEALLEKQKAKEERARRKETREKLQMMEKHTVLEQRARKAIQEFRRREDLANGYGCISCGKMPGTAALGLYAHEFDGGHFRAVGGHKNLSLDPLNIHAQCVYCNRDLKGNALEFRKGLIARYGLAMVERLESDNDSHKKTKTELVALAAHYRKKAREMKG